MKIKPLLLLGLFLLINFPLNFAASIVPYSRLADVANEAEAIVLARSVQNYDAREADFTFFRTDFETVYSLKGELPAESSFFLQAASHRTDFTFFAMSGDIQFEEETTYLFFLEKNKRGLWEPMLTSYYIFRSVEQNEEQLLVPVHSEVSTYNFEGRQIEPLFVYRQDVLMRMLAGIINGTGKWDNEAARSNFTKDDLLEFRAPDQCTWLGASPVRWRTFDSGGDVEVLQLTGASIPNCPGGSAALSSAISTMNSAYAGINLSGPSGKTITFNEGESSTSNITTNISSEQIGVIFNDPGSDVSGTYSCNSGGVLGRGGASWSVGPSSQHTFNGQQFNTIGKGYVYMNNSTDNCLCNSPSPSIFRLALIHELTHALGIGHHEGVPAGGANMAASTPVPINNIDEECLDFTYVQGALPIELAYFKGVQDHKTIQLNWASFSETNNEVFILEKSADGKHFELLEKIPGAGQSVDMRSYTFVDQQPFYGINYYRLSQTDYDGTTEYFDIISVSFKGKKQIGLAPNPVSNGTAMLDYHAEKEGLLTLKLYNPAGQLLRSLDQPANMGFNRFPIRLNDFQPGVYILQVIDGEAIPYTMKMTIL